MTLCSLSSTEQAAFNSVSPDCSQLKVFPPVLIGKSSFFAFNFTGIKVLKPGKGKNLAKQILVPQVAGCKRTCCERVL
jgi:hypothetical protein